MALRKRPGQAALRGLLLALAAVGTVVAIGVASAAPGNGVAAVTVREAGGGIVAREALGSDGSFALSYRHSVYGVPVRERFVALPDDGFRMVGVSSPSEAVLDYYAVDGTRRRQGGWWHLDLAAPSAHSALPMIASAHGRRTLLVGAARVPLHPREGHRTVTITVDQGATP